MSTTELPSGIYRIVVANAVEPTRLTRDGEHVTILPPGIVPEKDQEVMGCFMTSSTVCHSLVILVANHQG